MCYGERSWTRSEAARKAHVTRKVNKLQSQWRQARSAGKRAAIKRQINRLLETY